MHLRVSQEQRIFVSIASYRDPQLVPTIEDCLKKAAFPERLHFGICWQHDEEEDALPQTEDERFRVLDVHWRDSQGACWARAEIMKLWQGEEWFFQVDSHCRFAQDWDERLLQLVQELPSEKPIISTYAASFTPGPKELLLERPEQITFQSFTPEGIPQLKPSPLPLQRTQGYVRARFLAAGFLFAPGSFVEQVPYDPDLYFLGEEVTMSVRAFSHGFDLFHPDQTIVWHDYIRQYARKHWGDHTEANQITRPWSERDEVSRSKVQRLLRGESVGAFGLGPLRTMQDYEDYAGVSFQLRKVQDYTSRGAEPPNPKLEQNWTDHVYQWIAKVTIDLQTLPEDALSDVTLWCIAIQDEEGQELYRRDLYPFDLSLGPEHQQIIVVIEFPSGRVPSSWTVWPLSRTRGWLNKVGNRLQEDAFAILKEEDDLD